MFIYTHENEIINMDQVEHLYITEEEENDMFSLIATFRMSYTTVGTYKTKEEAIKVLNSIYSKIISRADIFSLEPTDTYPGNK